VEEAYLKLNEMKFVRSLSSISVNLYNSHRIISLNECAFKNYQVKL